MNAGDPPADELTPAERRLTQHLQLLRDSPPSGAAQLTTTVIRGVRWQRAVREPIAPRVNAKPGLRGGMSLSTSSPNETTPADTCRSSASNERPARFAPAAR